MIKRFRRLGRLFCCLLALAMVAPASSAADPLKTTVSGVIYRADGTPASGTLLISWQAFTTAAGDALAAGSMKLDIGAAGAVNLALVPTQGATPAGSYYKVVLTLNGVTSTEYWSVPTLSPATIAAIRSSVVPASVALQVVSREYVDSADAASVHKSGEETVAGVKTFIASPLLPEPAADLAAANKAYVDAAVAAGSGSGVVAPNKGGTGQSTWTAARCVRVANDGSKLESAAEDCGSAGGAASWGSITGTLSNQADLQTALDGKAAASHNHAGSYEPANANIQSHISSTSNPHGVTAGQVGAVSTTRTVCGHALSADVTCGKGDVGLGNADNTSDANKPISTATQAALNGKAPLTQPFVVGATFNGTLTADLVLVRLPMPVAVTIPQNCTNSFITLGTAPTADTTFSLARNYVGFGQIVVHSNGTLTITCASPTSFSVGDVLTLTAPHTPDATAANLGASIYGTR